MLNVTASSKIYVYTSVTDMRKGVHGLSGIVRGELAADPTDGSLFIFVNRRRDRLKVLWWDRSGYCLLAKRLEHGQFRVFDRADGRAGAFEMQASDLALILDGIDLRGAKRRLSHDAVTQSFPA